MLEKIEFSLGFIVAAVILIVVLVFADKMAYRIYKKDD